MISKGSLVRYTGKDKRLWEGKLLSVHERVGDKVVVWHDRKPNGKFSKITLNVKDLEEIIA